MKLLRWIRNLFAALLVVGICAVAVLVWQGYSMYSKAVSETPVSRMVEEVRKKKITLRWRTCLPFTGMR